MTCLEKSKTKEKEAKSKPNPDFRRQNLKNNLTVTKILKFYSKDVRMTKKLQFRHQRKDDQKQKHL